MEQISDAAAIQMQPAIDGKLMAQKTPTTKTMEPQQQQQQHEWKDPLLMLAKQCDTISGGGDEEQRDGGGGSAGKKQWAKGQQQQQNGSGEGTPRSGGTNGQHQQQKGKARSPNKPSIDQTACFPLPTSLAAAAAFQNGFMPLHPAAAQLAALMGPFMPQMPLPPAPPHPASAGPFHHQRPPLPPPFQTPPNFGPPNGGQPFPAPAQVNLMQQLLSAMQQQMPPAPHLMPPMFPAPHLSAPAGIPLPPSVPIAPRKQHQQQQQAQHQKTHEQAGGNGQYEQQQNHEDAAAAAAVTAVHLAAINSIFPGGLPPMPPPLPTASNGMGTSGALAGAGGQQQMTENGNANAQFLLQQPVQALLMAAASGQLPQFTCTYKLKEGQPCGRLFATDDQLFAHYKSAHIAQMSSPTAVSSTTAEGPISSVSNAAVTSQTPTTGTANGKARGGSKASPSSSRSTPTSSQQQNGNGTSASQMLPKPHSNPPAPIFNGWPAQMIPPGFTLGIGGVNGSQGGFIGGPAGGGGAVPGMNGISNHRFHPYLMPNGGQQPPKAQQQLAPPAAFAQQPSMQQQQQMAMLNLMSAAAAAGFGVPPNAPAPCPSELQPQAQSELAALAAMTNSIGANGTAAPPAPIGAGSG